MVGWVENRGCVVSMVAVDELVLWAGFQFESKAEGFYGSLPTFHRSRQFSSFGVTVRSGGYATKSHEFILDSMKLSKFLI